MKTKISLLSVIGILTSANSASAEWLDGIDFCDNECEAELATIASTVGMAHVAPLTFLGVGQLTNKEPIVAIAAGNVLGGLMQAFWQAQILGLTENPRLRMLAGARIGIATASFIVGCINLVRSFPRVPSYRTQSVANQRPSSIMPLVHLDDESASVGFAVQL